MFWMSAVLAATGCLPWLPIGPPLTGGGTTPGTSTGDTVTDTSTPPTDTAKTGQTGQTGQTGHTGSASTGDTGQLPPVAPDAITYRDDLLLHPGCSTVGLAYPPASIPGYTCAAKEYVGTENVALPIVVLVHGNSDTPASWEAYDSQGFCPYPGATEGQDMLSERLIAEGFRVYAVDLRYDLVDDPAGDNDTENLAKNMDHGWGVPIVQSLLRSVLDANPGRQISIVGFSYGATVARDAVRRLHVNDGVVVLPRIDDMVLLAGANHGISTYALCAMNPTMRGRYTCEVGDRAAFAPTPFLMPLNGPSGDFETPCSDGSEAFGRTRACGGHTVTYTTIVMQDLGGGNQQDLFVSEASAALDGATNVALGLSDTDESNYFFCGFFENHYGAARSTAALDRIVQELRP